MTMLINRRNDLAGAPAEVPDPRLAADHFIALTFGVTLSRLGSANAAKDSRVRPLIVEGVRAFLRAYRSG